MKQPWKSILTMTLKRVHEHLDTIKEIIEALKVEAESIMISGSRQRMNLMIIVR